MLFYQDRLIELLERKFDLVNQSLPADFLLELEQVIEWIMTDEVLKPYTEQLMYRFERRYREYEGVLDDERKQAVQLRYQLVVLFPELDDSGLQYTADSHGLPSREYSWSLAKFDDIVNQVQRSDAEVYHLSSNLYDDNTDVHPLLLILQNKIGGRQMTKATEEFYFALQHLEEAHSHSHRTFINCCRVSPAFSLKSLNDIIEMINPTPHRYSSPNGLIRNVFRDLVSLEGRSRSEIQRLVYGGVGNPELIDLCRMHLRRGHEEIRAAIGSRLVHYQLLQRYKARCMWYDRTKLTEMAESNAGRVEEVLTHNLALFLFDNGISTLYRIRRGAHEYDLMGDRHEANILVEAKQYRSSNHTRQDLITGIAQLHSYLNGLEADNLLIQEAYYVIYRLGGPLYDLPREIATNRHTIYPITIDLGSTQESGRRQPRPISIGRDEFFQAIVQGGETPTGSG